MIKNFPITKYSQAESFIEQLTSGFWPLHLAMYYQQEKYQEQITYLTQDCKKSISVIDSEFRSLIETNQTLKLNQERKRIKHFLNRINLFNHSKLINDFVQLVDSEYKKKGFTIENKTQEKERKVIELGVYRIAKSIYYGQINAELLKLKQMLLVYKSEGSNLPNKTPLEKIKWLGKASHLGFIMNELARKGYIEMPNYNGEANYSGYARWVLSVFDVKTTIGTMQNEVNENKNSMGESSRIKLGVLPYCNEIL